jgi:glycopeptide antibiotics resistance protein
MDFNLLKMKNDEKINKKLLTVLTVLYLILAVWVVVFKCNYNEGLFIEQNKSLTFEERLFYKAIPFEKFIYAIKDGGKLALVEWIALFFNVICFLPFGGFVRFFTKNKRTVVALGAAFSFAIEVYQLFSCWGGPDYMDILLNTLGVLLGAMIHEAIAPRLKEKTINKWAFGTSVFMLPFAVFAVVNSIINFPGF